LFSVWMPAVIALLLPFKEMSMALLPFYGDVKFIAPNFSSVTVS
jgi:hypothetical protein